MAQNRTSKVQMRGSVSAGHKQFDRELHVFESHKDAWLKAHTNDFVVISGSDVAGFYPTYAQAYAAALSHFGFDRLFLIKQVIFEEQVFVVY